MASQNYNSRIFVNFVRLTKLDLFEAEFILLLLYKTSYPSFENLIYNFLYKSKTWRNVKTKLSDDSAAVRQKRHLYILFQLKWIFINYHLLFITHFYHKNLQHVENADEIQFQENISHIWSSLFCVYEEELTNHV